MNLLTGQPDSRSTTGEFARGTNMYPGGNAPNTGPNKIQQPQQQGGSDLNLRAAVMRKLAKDYGFKP